MDKHSPDYDQLLEEAGLWVSRIHTSELDASEKSAFSRWLNTSKAHERAYDEMATVWSATEVAKHAPKLRSEAEYLSKRRVQEPFARKAAPLALAASILLMVGFFTLKTFDQSTSPHAELYSTKIGEQRTFELEDGSEIRLNTHSQVEVSMDSDSRDIRLLRGEAYFEVAKDKSRPFEVSIGDHTVKAVGTAFNIYRKPQKTVVAITEGVVEIKANADDAPLIVDAKNRVVIDDDAVASINHSQLKIDTAWQTQQIIARDTPLSSVFLELNRYLSSPVRLRDSKLHELKVSGTFNIRNPELVLQGLLESFDLVEEQVGKSRVISSASI